MQLFNSFGNAPWIYSYYPFINSFGKKALCSILNVPLRFIPVGPNPSEEFQESRVRIIEIIECDLGIERLVGVLEVVHPRNWQGITRYVVLDIFAVCEALRLTNQLNSTIDSSIDPAVRKELPVIELLDEVVSYS